MSDLGDMLRTATDRELEKIQNEVATEGAIRTIMKDTGEPRDIVTEMIEAGQAMRPTRTVLSPMVRMPRRLEVDR